MAEPTLYYSVCFNNQPNAARKHANGDVQFMNQEEIERRINAFDGLVEALKKISDPARRRDLSKLMSAPMQNGAVYDIQLIANEALAAAEGKES